MQASTHHFRYLDLTTYLARIASNIERSSLVLGCISPKGFTASQPTNLNDHGLIQLCLLNTTLFDFDDAFTSSANKIWDLRIHRLQTCQDRSKLIDGLAKGLLHYEQHSLQEDIGEPTIRCSQTQKEFRRIMQVLFAYLRLRDKKDFPVPPRLRHLSKSTVTKAYETIALIIDTLRPEDYRAICQDERQLFKGILVATSCPETGAFYNPTTIDSDLLLHMYTTFKGYGPKHHYTQNAVFRAIATIYIAFGLEEENDLPVVASRLLKRFQRMSPPSRR
jgi:hypothetical protein